MELQDMSQMVGKTVERIEIGEVEQAYGSNPTVSIYFTDGTRIIFTLPQEEE